MCTKELAQQYLAPTLRALSINSGNDCDHASISSEDFVVISVEGEGLDAGQRVVELTTPLALAGMYVSDLLFPKDLLQKACAASLLFSACLNLPE